MLEETSIFTLTDKVLLWQKCQNDVLCGNMNTDVSPYILKFKIFFKNTCSTMVAWIHVGLLQSKSEIIYLPKTFCLIIIRRSPTHILDMSCCHKHQQQRYHNGNTKICIFLHYMCIDIVFPLTKAIPIMFQRVTTYQQTLKTWIGHNFNALPDSLPYIFSQFSMDSR